MANVLIIPHVGVSGGAGLYINQVLSEITKSHNVYVGGIYSSDFNFKKYEIDSVINKIVFPYYMGISSKAYLFHYLKSISYMSKNKYLLKRLHNKDKFEIVVLTSGIQVSLLPIINNFFKNAKVIILIQENFRLDGHILGKIVKKNLLKADLIVSITNDWKSYSKSYGIESFLFRNMYKPSVDNIKIAVKKDFDFIYLGGEQKIKGYLDVVDFCQKMSKIRSFRIAILGEISTESKKNLLEFAGSSKFTVDIVFFGFLKNATDIIKRAKILLLPITSPHFCRPAIEAGFEGIPFLIRRHDDISDFAIEGYNCEMYSDLKEMTNKAIRFLKDNEYTKEIGMNNHNTSKNFIYNDHLGNAFIKVVEDILK